MNRFTYFFLLILLALGIVACDEAVVLPELPQADCQPAFQDSSAQHPKAALYQQILDENRKRGLVGAVLLVKDQDGLWQGSSGKANLSTGLDMTTCHPFFVASITKVFTATIVLSLLEEGKLALDDPISKWIPASEIEGLPNADQATIAQLLGHTSGIPDYYTLGLELDLFNQGDNGWLPKDFLSYAANAPADHAPGETYAYSNTGYILLGMVAESVADKSLKELYQDRIFTPLGLQSAYYDPKRPIPTGVARGYVDLYGNGDHVESSALYKDELATPDGGIAINAHDLSLFIEALAKGRLIDQNSLSEMQNWFDLPEGWEDDILGHTRNGYGLEYFEKNGTYALGHTGAIYGYLSMMFYFPEEDATFILLVNSASYDYEPRMDIYEGCLELMME